MNRNARITASAAVALALSIAFAACDFLGLSGPSGPGELHATVTSSRGTPDGAAAVLELTGLTSPEYIKCDQGQVFHRSDGTTTRVVVVLDGPGPIIFFLRVKDVADLPSGTVIQVADGNNELVSSVEDYEIEWMRVADSDLDAHRRHR